MKEKFEKLNSLLENEEFTDELAVLTAEEIRGKLAEKGVVFSDSELKEALKSVNAGGELDEEALEEVSGGAKKKPKWTLYDLFIKLLGFG